MTNNNRPKYKTKKREELISYLASVSGHFTAADVYDYFRASGTSIGQATVYRQLDRLICLGVQVWVPSERRRLWGGHH